MTDKKAILQSFQEIPGVGKAIAQDLYNLGFRSISDLKGKDPEKLYKQLCDYQQADVDRCMLYVMRCAVYYASEKNHDPQLLKWWHWKD